MNEPGATVVVGCVVLIIICICMFVYGGIRECRQSKFRALAEAGWMPPSASKIDKDHV